MVNTKEGWCIDYITVILIIQGEGWSGNRETQTIIDLN